MIKTIKDKYEISVDLFEFNVPFEKENSSLKTKYIIGGYYNKISYPMIAFFPCDSDGNVTDSSPIIQEDGFGTYEKLFKHLGYTLL